MKKSKFSIRSSLYSKLVVAYFAVIFISFVLLAVLLSAWFEHYYYSERESVLLSEAPIINGLMEDYGDGTISPDNMSSALTIIDKLIDARIWIINRYRFLIASSSTEEWLNTPITSDDIGRVLKGETLKLEGVFEQELGTRTLTVAFPLKNSYNQIVGAAIMNTPIYGIENELNKVYMVIWISAVVAIIISTIIIYYLSERILIKPLYEINKTAKAISGGKFEERVNITSEDEIGELARSFNDMADSLQNLENLRRNFVANISHELRSPITSIRGFIEGIIDGTIPESKQKQYLNIVLNESKRLSRLISDVLDLSRLESGEFPLTMGIFDINELIRLNIIRFENEIESKELNVDVTLSGDELYAVGDRDRIGQVISNLIDNAIKFTPVGGQISIKTNIQGKKVVVEVSDTGIGISPKELKFIWDRFYMVDKSRTTKRGTGLGLSIVRQIINQHGEKIWVNSTEGKGTTFTFTLNLSENME